MKKTLTLLMLATSLLVSIKSYCVPKLSSYPAATATVFLDFDGHFVNSSMWNNGIPFMCAPAAMTDAQITEAFYRVAEDFRPFEINITTDSTVFLAAPLVKRIRVIVTPTSGWFPGASGISYVGAFHFGDDTPSFVFSDQLGNSPKSVAEACSHETGHSLGLNHQASYSPTDCVNPSSPYNSGIGSGEIGWAPIMGWSLGRNMTNWNNGPTPYYGCATMEDNLSIITTQNGFSYRADDYPETLNASTFTLPSTNFNASGIITTSGDKDAFRFVLAQNSNFHLTAIPYNVGAGDAGANLDIKLEVYNAAGNLINTYDPAATMSVTVDTVLNSGTYYIKISGTGNMNISSYGSLGSYTISGNTGTLPIHDISLSGIVDKSKHNLNWSIIADEPIKTIVVESSADGSNFKTLTTVSPTANKFSYYPYQSDNIYYRLKVTSVLDQSLYSNTIVLRGTSVADKSFSVSTLVKNDILVNAAVNYQYQLSDMNGRTIGTGNGLKGVNRIDFNAAPDGMYIIRLFNDNQAQTEKIIKQ